MSFVLFYPEHLESSLVTGVQRPSSIGPVVASGSSVTKAVFRGKFSSLCAALILQQFVYHNRERGVAFGQVCMVMWYAVMHKRPLVASVLRVMVEGLLGTFCPLLSTAVDSGKESTVSETHTVHAFSALTRLPLQWSDVATLIDTDFCNMHKRNTQLKLSEADQKGVAALVFIN